MILYKHEALKDLWKAHWQSCVARYGLKLTFVALYFCPITPFPAIIVPNWFGLVSFLMKKNVDWNVQTNVLIIRLNCNDHFSIFLFCNALVYFHRELTMGIFPMPLSGEKKKMGKIGRGFLLCVYIPPSFAQY